MTLKSIFYIAIATTFLVSCGSNKNVVYKKRKKVVLQQKEITPEIFQLEQVKKPLKTTVNHTEAYIQKFAPIAVKKMHEHKIPASITLAQGVLESGSGRSALAIRSNNHFGIKCHRGWQGKSVTHDDDEIGECFRKYKYPQTSYEDHSQFLISRSRYASLFNLGHTNYKGWAYGLRKAGYATDKRYPQKLIGIIKKYNLSKYDKIKNPAQETKNISSKVAYHSVQKGDTLYSIARKYQISVSQLKKMNKLKNNSISIGEKLELN
ncbi:glucosaminidase domain-containing protein [Tenacibaculum piscium]|uniref:glucosaminidase domain-containing protein n=1 Tax=Tenacibaculum piscium TaxID=1458515 RepID=UPI001EFB5A48|nr:glucosaminidase domain-containing protein [Tenacibaculum piscium]MCG8182774.1 glucosaminidase domain-containing protein [Tenacibaculum piscium]MCG8204166.1 glucosaminidase domain-containing protein [Tenacibaculum piscium]